MLTESQLRERKKGIGGSDAAAICGLSRWKTPLDVYIDKTSDEIIKQEENQYTYWGNAIEPLIIEKYQEETGKIVFLNKQIIAHPIHKFMIGNVDGVIAVDQAILECKTADLRTSKNWGETGSDNFPEEYLMQCAHYAIVSNAPYVDLAVLIGGNDFRIYTYQRNSELEGLIIQIELEFWNENVLKRVPPESRTEADLNKLIKETTGKMKSAPESIKSLLTLIKKTERDIKKLEKTKDDLSLVIKQTISDYDGLVDEFGETLCTWKIQETKRFDCASFKKSNPDVYNQFIKKSNSRVFRMRREQGE